MEESFGSRRGVVARAVDVAMLRISAYEEVEADQGATAQAAIVVAATAIAAAIASSGQGAPGIIGGLLNAFISWAVWAGATNFVGTRLFGGTADWGELLRTLGFAQAPGVLLVLAVIPLLGWIVSLAVGIWMLITGVVAIRQALDFDTVKAIVTALVAMIALWVVALILTALLGASVGVVGFMGRP